MKKLFRIVVVIAFLGTMQFQSSCSEPDTDSDPVPADTEGDATFWLATDLGVGNITVICNGMTQIITGYYPSTPSCGASSSANFNMPPGTYNYTASAGNTTWNGTISITAGGCSKLQLIGSGGAGPANNVLNGNWKSSGGLGITISGNQGVFYTFSSNWQTAANGGYVNIGTVKVKNITSLNNNQWSCRDLWMTATNGIINGTQWSNDGTISMNANGTVITVTSTGPVSGLAGSVVYNKQ
jgi:hypothetical protein